MTTVLLSLLLAVTTINVDVISLPYSEDVRAPLAPTGRAELKREGAVTRVKIEIDRIALPMTFSPVLNTFVVWAISPEGILDSLGELDINGSKGLLTASSRLSVFGILITAEPHHMVDQPSSAVAYRSQTPVDDIRRRSVPVDVGVYEYAGLKPTPAPGMHGSIAQARAAFQIAQNAGAERLAATEFRNAQIAFGSMEELVRRAAPMEILWPTANEAIRWSQRATMAARAVR